MRHEEMSEKLYEKASNEMESYRNWMLQQTPAEILEHTFEYSSKLDILITLADIEAEDLTGAQLAALLESPCPLEDIYKEYCNSEINHLDQFRECAGELADRLIKSRQEQSASKGQSQHRPSVCERLAAKAVPADKSAAKPKKQVER